MLSLAVSLISFFIFISPTVLFAGEIVTSDAHYEKYANGIVKDTKNGLEWLVGPDRDTDWNQAKMWVENLTVDGGGWRMPTRKELISLYKEGAGSRNMTSLLKTTGWIIWSGETYDSSSAWRFNFDFGEVYGGIRGHSYGGSRGFAVRSRR
jgi:hypothetical protein